MSNVEVKKGKTWRVAIKKKGAVDQIWLEFDADALPDIERIPRGMYLTEVYAGDLGCEPGYFVFNINKRANSLQVAKELVEELEYTAS